jgi:hypothetical protein
MAKKITISVPDDLHEKMKEWKSALNFSKVFQNAVSGLIKKKESLKSKICEEIDFSSIVDRLKKEKIEFEANIIEKGKNDGMEWSKTAHYSELRYALTWDPDENAALDEKLGEYFSYMFDKYKEWLSTTGKKAQDRINELSGKYLKGWKEGVELFWNEVKDKI